MMQIGRVHGNGTVAGLPAVHRSRCARGRVTQQSVPFTGTPWWNSFGYDALNRLARIRPSFPRGGERRLSGDVP